MFIYYTASSWHLPLIYFYPKRIFIAEKLSRETYRIGLMLLKKKFERHTNIRFSLETSRHLKCHTFIETTRNIFFYSNNEARFSKGWLTQNLEIEIEKFIKVERRFYWDFYGRQLLIDCHEVIWLWLVCQLYDLLFSLIVLINTTWWEQLAFCNY